MDTSADKTSYLEAFKGRFTSTMRWHDLDDFWDSFRSRVDDDWYLYAVGEQPPVSTASKEQVLGFIDEIDTLLRKEHEEDYCGIVYYDDKEDPRFVKIFDPNNLGVSCGFSEKPPLPGWILSKLKPVELEDALYPANNRRRWWQRLFE